MRIDNSVMLSHFDAADREKHYCTCADIALAGDDYKVVEIAFFAKNSEDPISDYIQVKKYDDRFLLIGVNTQDKELISECLAYVKDIQNEQDEIELRTSFSSVLDHEGLKSQFSLHETEYPLSPIYYIHSESELREISHNPSVSVARVTEADKIEIAQCVKEGLLDAECMGEDMFRDRSCYKDVIWYILRVDGRIAGYLRGECGYANIYDIGWLYVEERYRGKGYAAELVLCFAHDLFSIGDVPHYGFAISKESVRVAEKCGFQCDKSTLICRRLEPKP